MSIKIIYSLIIWLLILSLDRSSFYWLVNKILSTDSLYCIYTSLWCLLHNLMLDTSYNKTDLNYKAIMLSWSGNFCSKNGDFCCWNQKMNYMFNDNEYGIFPDYEDESSNFVEWKSNGFVIWKEKFKFPMLKKCIITSCSLYQYLLCSRLWFCYIKYKRMWTDFIYIIFFCMDWISADLHPFGTFGITNHIIVLCGRL